MANKPTKEEEEELLAMFRTLDQGEKDRWLRFAKRIAEKPAGMPLSKEQMQAMFDDDRGPPLH